MNSARYTCFFVMPFLPELHYFYLFLKSYLENNHAIRVERGDQAVLTIALLDKIKRQILASDFLIAEITGKNANVFYEVGIAHANKKPIIFLTQDKPENVPVDIRQFEVIQYSLADEINLLKKIDSAVQNIFRTEFDELYNDAIQALHRFNESIGASYESADREEFQARVMRVKSTRKVPVDKETRDYVEFILPKIISQATEMTLMKNLTNWIDETYPVE